MERFKIVPLLFSLLLGTFITGCCFGGSSLPTSPGVYVSTASGWRMLTAHERDAFAGSYPSTRGLSRSDLPACTSPCNLLIVNVPLDPTRLRFGVVDTASSPWDVRPSERSVPVLQPQSEGVYSATIADSTLRSDQAIVATLVERNPNFSGRAFLFIMRGH
jgi:hypothetical protein